MPLEEQDLSLSALPIHSDEFNHVISYLPMKDLMALRQVCQEYTSAGESHEQHLNLIQLDLDEASSGQLSYYARSNYHLALNILSNPNLMDKLYLNDLIRIIEAHPDLLKRTLFNEAFTQQINKPFLLEILEKSPKLALEAISSEKFCHVFDIFDVLNLAFRFHGVAEYVSSNRMLMHEINELLEENTQEKCKLSKQDVLYLLTHCPNLNIDNFSSPTEPLRNNPLLDIYDESSIICDFKRLSFKQSSSKSHQPINLFGWRDTMEEQLNLFSKSINEIKAESASAAQSSDPSYLQNVHALINITNLAAMELFTELQSSRNTLSNG